jgi:Glu-tRNA(Gln) amidotransferase subunit E-like FAD-binding protein
MIFSLHNEDGNECYKGKNTIQVYNALTDNNKKRESDYTEVYKQYVKQLAKEKVEEIIDELILAGIEFNIQQFYDEKVFRDNIIAKYRGKKKGEIILELDIMKPPPNPLLKI